MNDTRSTTGSNIRKLLLLTGKDNIDDVTVLDIENLVYEEISEDEMWRVGIVQEMTEIKFGQLTIEGFSEDECTEILRFACTS